MIIESGKEKRLSLYFISALIPNVDSNMYTAGFFITKCLSIYIIIIGTFSFVRDVGITVYSHTSTVKVHGYYVHNI